MNSIEQKPNNMTRVMLISNDGITLEFGFYKDGMFKPDGSDDWNQPYEYDGWIEIKEVKFKLGIS